MGVMKPDVQARIPAEIVQTYFIALATTTASREMEYALLWKTWYYRLNQKGMWPIVRTILVQIDAK